MPEERELEKQLRVAAKTGDYIVGRREVQSSIKGSKLLVWSASSNLPQSILDECRSLSVPAVRFNGNPVELGRACGIPFRVSVIALKTVGDADVASFAKSSDYLAMAGPAGTLLAPIASATVPETKEAEDAKRDEKKGTRKSPKKGEIRSEEKPQEEAKPRRRAKSAPAEAVAEEEEEEPAAKKRETSEKKGDGEKESKKEGSDKKKRSPATSKKSKKEE